MAASALEPAGRLFPRNSGRPESRRGTSEPPLAHEALSAGLSQSVHARSGIACGEPSGRFLAALVPGTRSQPSHPDIRAGSG